MYLSPSEIMQHNVETLSRFVAPLLVYKKGEQNASNWITGGTVFLAQTSANRFLVTADHVIEDILKREKEGPLHLMLCGKSCGPLDISDWEIICRDERIDICTVQVPISFNADVLNRTFFDLNNWPHPRAVKYDKAFILGYPSGHRTGESKIVNIRLLPISDFVTDVGPRRFTMADETNEREIILNSPGFGVPKHFGGMSGAPVFRMLENSIPEFIGVFSEGSDGIHGVFFSAHADFICPDGKLNFAAIPL